MNAIPTIRKVKPNHSGRLFNDGSVLTARAISSNFSVPVTPYTQEMPYSRQPDAIAPSTKYFMADSADVTLFRSIATSAYIDSARVSRPRYIVSRLFAEIMIIMPSSPNRPSK